MWKKGVKSSVFLFSGEVTMVSFIPKDRHSVLLASSLHHDNKINNETRKPEIIHFYNKSWKQIDYNYWTFHNTADINEDKLKEKYKILGRVGKN